jgi:hypothetical protein
MHFDPVAICGPPRRRRKARARLPDNRLQPMEPVAKNRAAYRLSCCADAGFMLVLLARIAATDT